MGIDAMPTRKLNLAFHATPENGPNFAAQFRNAVQSNENITLDFSVESLALVDSFLQHFSDQGLHVNDFAETIFVAGCYVGQVMVQNHGGQWIRQEDANLPAGITMTPLIIRLPNNKIADPVTKAFKRFSYGITESIPYFYHVFTTP